VSDPEGRGRARAAPSARRWGRLAAVTAAAVYLLIVLGGIVRITGSGMGCGPDWPLCNGALVPLMDLETFIEWSHRMMAAGVGLLVVGVAAHAWWPPGRGGGDSATGPSGLGRGDGSGPLRRGDFRTLSAWAVVLLVVQVLLGAVTVRLELPPASVILHLGTAMALLAVLLVGVSRALFPGDRRPPDGTGSAAWLAAALGLAVVLAGALVANLGAAPACQGFPLCNGRWLPEGGWRIHLHWAHRVSAYLLVAGVLALALHLQRERPGDRMVRGAGWAAAALALLQIGVGAAMVLAGLPEWIRALHLAVGAGLFGALVVTAVLARRRPARSGGAAGEVGEARPAAERAGAAAQARERLADYVRLTKPRIVVLLLVTTVVPMYVAGSPSLGLVVATLLGGYLMAGAANAVNMYLDRDIDGRMERTRDRPIPGGRLSPGHVLGFGVAVAAVAFLVLAAWTTLLAAALAFAGLLFYVFVYTRWLKRSTPLNIVIGGAAGAFPPLVGWAAVTGEVSLTAWFFFFIVFYWTPPHFWALALVMEDEYEAAGVPMAPVVWGRRKTRRQILAYTLVLLPLTLVPVLYGEFGAVYGLLALALGGHFLWRVMALFRGTRSPEGKGREASDRGAAIGLFRYSLLYLALLFGGMLVDRSVPVPVVDGGPAARAARAAQVEEG